MPRRWPTARITHCPPNRRQLIAAVRELTAGRGVDLVFDPVGGDLFDAALRVTARKDASW